MATSKVTVHPAAVRQEAPGRAAEMALVERCRRGELGAFEELYRAHAGRLYSLAMRMTGSPSDTLARNDFVQHAASAMIRWARVQEREAGATSRP